MGEWKLFYIIVLCRAFLVLEIIVEDVVRSSISFFFMLNLRNKIFEFKEFII